jgi:hypothetical protein
MIMPATSLANEGALQMVVGSIVHFTNENYIASIASWFPVCRLADAMVTDCRLLVDWWSENGNERFQL